MGAFRALLSLYPGEFRDEYGRELAMVFADRYRDAPSRAARARLWIEGFAGILREAPREHLAMAVHHLRHAVRTLRQHPLFAITITATLAVGIGANASIFSLVDVVLLRSLPFPHADRLAMVWEEAPRLGTPKAEASVDNYLDWARQSEAFEELGAYLGNASTLSGDAPPERLDIVQVTPNVFSILGVGAAIGRVFSPSEGGPGNAAVAILSHALWQRRFGSDRTIVGRSILLNGRPHTVIGVMPQGFQFPREDTQLWTPVLWAPDTVPRSTHMLRVVGRLKAGRTWTEAQTEFSGIASRLALAYPATNANYGARVIPLHDEFVQDARRSLWLLQAAALLVLLVMCANVAGLLITRSMGRRREIAVRIALGASRRQIVRQLVIEGLTVATVGGLLGLLLTAVAAPSLDAMIPATLRGAVRPEVDWRMLGMTVTMSAAAGLLFGLAPLGAVLRSDIRSGLGGRGADHPRDRSRALLVVAQIATAVVVMVSTGLLLRTIVNLSRVDPGFRSANVLTARLELSGRMTLEDRKRFYREVLDRVRELPGVVSAGFTTFLPYTNFGGGSRLSLEDRPDLPDSAYFAYRREVTPDYLPTIGVRLISGRGFDKDDDLNHPQVVIVNEYVAHLLGGDAIGKRLKLGPPANPWITIAGVVANIREEGLDTPTARGTVYVPVAQTRDAGYLNPRDLAIRVAGDPIALVPALERAVWSINKDQSVSRVRVMGALVDAQIAARRMQVGMVTAFAAVILFLAAFGIHGLMSFVVATRTQELGLRMALGADRTTVAAAIVRRAMTWMAAGVAIGLMLALLVAQGLEGMLFGVEPVDPITLGGVVMVVLLAGSLSMILPVLRITRIDPLAALRLD